jgi:Phage derived protein Gp49-like (DUF891)
VPVATAEAIAGRPASPAIAVENAEAASEPVVEAETMGLSRCCGHRGHRPDGQSGKQGKTTNDRSHGASPVFAMKLYGTILCRGCADPGSRVAASAREGKLWELRLTGRDGIARALYVTAIGRRVVVVRAFVKKTQKTPPAEIKLALRRAKEIT